MKGIQVRAGYSPVNTLSLPSAHHGLIGLRQRAELLGGTVSSGPRKSCGYELHVELPIEDT
ncbi:MAG: hypothetical protein ACJ736_25485 [Streptomyces sp.]